MRLRLSLSLGALALVAACGTERPPVAPPVNSTPPTSAPVPPVSPVAVPRETPADAPKADDPGPQPTARPTQRTTTKAATPKKQDPAIGAWERARREAMETPLPVPPAATQPVYATPR